MAMGFPIEPEGYDYVLDKGPLLCFNVSEEGELSELASLRAFELKQGYATSANVPGHYFVNDTDISVSRTGQPIDTPALLHFKDSSNPPVFVLWWKRGPNNKVYLATIPTAVKISTDKDGVDKWVSEDNVVPVKLELVDRLEQIENRDGQPLGKALDEWIKDHSKTFKALGIKSLLDCRSWCQYLQFEKHVPAVSALVEKALLDEIRLTATGEQDEAAVAAAAAKSKKPANSEAMSGAQQALLNKRLPPLQAVAHQLKLHAAFLKVPPSYRIIDLDFGDFAPDTTNFSDSDLKKLLHESTSTEHYPKLLEVLKTSDKLAIVKGLTGGIDFNMSPLKALPPPTEEDDNSNSEFAGRPGEGEKEAGGEGGGKSNKIM